MIDINKLDIKESFLKIKKNNPGLSEIFNIFKKSGYNIRIVGGCVRNLLLLKQVTDFDLTTDALPEQIIAILKKDNIKYFTPGIKHGTINFIFKNIEYEITTLRKDLKCDGRHALVEFSKDFSEDASRRDLTINAMSLDEEGNLFDYFTGVKDLEIRMIRFVGDPFLRAPEDYLRILRLYRFYSYYGCRIDERSRKACQENAANIKTLSKERIWQEFAKILISPQNFVTLKLMEEDNILYYILNDITINYKLFNNLIKICNLNNIEQTIIRNYFCLTYGNNSDHPLIMIKKNKIYLDHFKKIFEINHNVNNNLNKYLYIYGKDLLIEQLILDAAIEDKNLNINLIATIKELEMPNFPLHNRDIISKYGLQGRALGLFLKKSKEIWLNSNCKLNKEMLLREIDAEFKRSYSEY